MEAIGNLEVLKVGNYLKVYIKGWNYKERYVIVKVRNVSKEKLTCSAVRETIKENGEEKHSFFSEVINTFIIAKKIKKSKKKKLKKKSYSYNEGFIIFKLNQNEGDRIIKEAILQRLEN